MYSNTAPAVLGMFIDKYSEQDFDPCVHAEYCKQKIMQALCECATLGNEPVQIGDETYDKEAWVRTLKNLYDWLTEACAKKDPVVAIITTARSCYDC